MAAAAVARVEEHAENKAGHRKFNSYKLPQWVRHPQLQQPEKVAILFPGEQNHTIGMLKDAKRNIEVQRMLALASEAFGFDLEELMAKGPIDKMARTGYNQPLTYVANCAAYEMLKASYPKVAASPQGVAGFSIGEYSALVAAGVVTFEQGLSLVKVRAEAMQALSEELDMEAVNIWGFDYNKVENLCTKAIKRDDAADPKVYVARVWGPEGYVCAGRKSTVLKLEELAKKEGKAKEVRLLGLHAAHTPLAQKAADTVAAALDQMLSVMNPPRCELYLNATGWRVPPGTSPSKFISALKEQLISPLMWEGSIDQMQRWGIKEFYECGPGRSLKFFLQGYEFIEECPLAIKYPGQHVVNVSV